MSKKYKVGFSGYVKALGFAGAIRHFMRVARNRSIDVLVHNPKRTYVILGSMPAVLGVALGAFCLTSAFPGAWWSIFSKAGGVAIIATGIVLSYAILKVSPAYLGQITGLLASCARRLVFIGALIGMAAYLGDTPMEKAIWLLSLSAFLFAITPILYRTYRFARWQAAQPLMQKKINWHDRKFSEDEIWRICVHEAGHAVAYGLWDRLPEDASAGISMDVEVHIGGYAWGAWATYAIEWTDDVADALLIQLCCGSAAESAILGSQCYGNSDDIGKFGEILSKRCAHDFNLGYRLNPESDFDRSHNERIEKNHRDMILRNAKQLVEANKETIIQIANLLKEREFLDCMDLHPIWRAIKLPEGLKKAPTPSLIPCLPLDFDAPVPATSGH